MNIKEQGQIVDYLYERIRHKLMLQAKPTYDYETIVGIIIKKLKKYLLDFEKSDVKVPTKELIGNVKERFYPRKNNQFGVSKRVVHRITKENY